MTERTEKLMMKAVVRYREDRDLENAIDFIQKKVSSQVSAVETKAALNPLTECCCVPVPVLRGRRLPGLVP